MVLIAFVLNFLLLNIAYPAIMEKRKFWKAKYSDILGSFQADKL